MNRPRAVGSEAAGNLLITALAGKALVVPILVHGLERVGSTLLAAKADFSVDHRVAADAIGKIAVVEKLGFDKRHSALLAVEAVLVPLGIEGVDEEVEDGFFAGLADTAHFLQIVLGADHVVLVVEVKDTGEKVLAADTAVETAAVDVLESVASGTFEVETHAVSQRTSALMTGDLAFFAASVDVDLEKLDAGILGGYRHTVGAQRLLSHRHGPRTASKRGPAGSTRIGSRLRIEIGLAERCVRRALGWG